MVLANFSVSGLQKKARYTLGKKQAALRIELDRNSQLRENGWNSIKWIKPDENPTNLLKGVSYNGEWYREMVQRQKRFWIH